MTEINKITESPEYNNFKYSGSAYKNTIIDKNAKDDIDEYNFYDSPQANGSLDNLHKRGLVVNVSGNKKSINHFDKIKDTLSQTTRMTDLLLSKKKVNFSNEILEDKPVTRSSESNYQPQKEKGRKKKHHMTSSVNFNHKKVMKSPNYTQRLHTDSLAISPSKRGIQMVPIQSKQREFKDSFDKDTSKQQENEPSRLERKKKNRNIARDFNTNGNMDGINKRSAFYFHDQHRDQINEDKASSESSHNVVEFSEDIPFPEAPLDVNFTPENEEYGSDEPSVINKAQMLHVEDRRSFPEPFDGLQLSKKNTPLKSISTKTKGSLSGFGKSTSPNKSFNTPKQDDYGTGLHRRKYYDAYKRDQDAIITQ